MANIVTIGRRPCITGLKTLFPVLNCTDCGSQIYSNQRQASKQSSLFGYHPILNNRQPQLYWNQCRYYGIQDFYLKYFTPDNPPVAAAIKVLESVHDYTGLPWWAALPLTVIMVRSFVTLPMLVYATRNAAKLENLQPEIKHIATELNVEVNMARKKYDWNDHMTRTQFAVNMKRLVRNLYLRDNCHPFKAAVVVIVQLPVWILFSVALRNMSGAFFNIDLPVLTASLQTEGALWFSNLTIPDPTFALPIIFTVTNLIITEVSVLQSDNQPKLMKIATNFFRGLSLIMFPVAAVMPSCMAYYWTCSSLYGLVGNLALKAPSVRRMCRIPKTVSESSHPYRDMAVRARRRFTKKHHNS